jgi:hypothetical protein
VDLRQAAPNGTVTGTFTIVTTNGNAAGMAYGFRALVYLRLPILAQVGHDGAQQRLVSDLVAAHRSERERCMQPQGV